MTSLTTIVSRAAIAAGAVGLLSAGVLGASAQQAPQVPRGWFKACNKQQDIDICNVQNIVLAETGQLVTAVNLIELKGKVNRKVLQVSVPTSRLVQPGVSMQVDGGKATKIDYATCFQDRCVAEVALTDALVGNFKKGTELTLTSFNFQNQPNPIKITLEGFTGAFDGAPLQQADMEDRQKAAQEYIVKNQQKLAETLKAAQEKAKQGN
jgi:invasion protein IalB